MTLSAAIRQLMVRLIEPAGYCVVRKMPAPGERPPPSFFGPAVPRGVDTSGRRGGS